MPKKTIIALATAAMLATAAQAQSHRLHVTATADTAVIEMADITTLRVSVTGQGPDLPTPLEPLEPRKDYHGVEIVDINTDTTDIPDGRRRIDWVVRVQAFEPGMVTIPGFRFVSDGDTTESDIITLKVNEVDLDTLTTINPMVSVQAPPRKWYDWIPDWWPWALAAVALIALIAGLMLLWRNRERIIPALRKPVEPPYDAAMRQLNDLRSRRLAESGQEKEFYTRVTDILRTYLEGRFGIYAMEMTTPQIVKALRRDRTVGTDTMQRILEMADFVKFAGVRPMPDDNIRILNDSIDFVESTKPEPEPENAENTENKSDK